MDLFIQDLLGQVRPLILTVAGAMHGLIIQLQIAPLQTNVMLIIER